MITVLHLRDTDRVCGPGKTIMETALAATAGEFRHKVGLLLLERETTNLYIEALNARGVEVVPLRTRHQLDPRILLRMVRAIREHQVDLIHSHEYKSDLLAFALSRIHRIPIITTVHGWIRNHLKSRMYIRAGQAVLPRFDRVIAVSGETRKAILACGVPPARVALIHNAIVAERYDPADQQRGAVRGRYGIPAEAPLIGYIGRLSPEKGQKDLIAAAAIVTRTRPDARFLFCGDGPDRAALEQQARDLGLADRVIFTGHLQDVRPVYRDLDVHALTSYTEGFPNVVLESLCMGVPVLANDVGGTREIVEDGVTGILLPAGQPERIAAGLLRLLNEPAWARELARNGHAVVMRDFSFKQRVLKEEALCRDVLAERQR